MAGRGHGSTARVCACVQTGAKAASATTPRQKTSIRKCDLRNGDDMMRCCSSQAHHIEGPLLQQDESGILGGAGLSRRISFGRKEGNSARIARGGACGLV